MRAFLTPVNGNQHVLLALGSDRPGRDDVEISRGRGQSACSRRFICVKPSANAVQHAVSSFFEVG